MTKVNRAGRFVSLLLVAFSLSTPALADEVSTAVSEYCTCTKPLLSQATAIMQAMQSGQMEKMAQLATEMESNSSGMIECMQKLKDKYGDRVEDEAFNEKVKAGIEGQCPNPMKAMAEQMTRSMQGMPGMPGAR